MSIIRSTFAGMAGAFGDPDAEQEFREELARIDRMRRTYYRDRAEHPDCRDPDHPGCEYCEEFEGLGE